MKTARHGTNSKYAGGCRCAECREAHREYMHMYYLRNRSASITRAKTYAREHPEQAREWARSAYRRHKDERAARKSAYAKENRHKCRAYKMVLRAINSGVLKRQPCEVCGATEVHAHHDDYSQPLAVRWLCPSHHGQHHAKRRKATADGWAAA